MKRIKSNLSHIGLRTEGNVFSSVTKKLQKGVITIHEVVKI